MNSTIKLFVLVFATFLFSCENNEKKGTLDTQKITKGEKISFQNLNESGYKGQLPYISIKEGDTGFSESIAKLELDNKINNKNYDWSYFDSLYNSNLSDYEKQNLSFIILSTKDLIGLSQNYPENEEYKIAVKKYISVLTETKYVGYCLLYNALNSVIEDSEFVKKQASKIIEYSKEDKFHRFNLNNKELKETPFYKKIKENYRFLELINKF